MQRARAAYVTSMTNFLGAVLFVLMVGVLGVLGAGIYGMARGGDPARSNRLMRWRVILQGAAILVFVLLLMSRG